MLTIYHWNTTPYEKQLIQNNEDFEHIFINSENEMDLIKQSRDAEIITIFIHNPIASKTLAQLPNLRLICTRSTGMDHIDLETCKAKNIEVKNVQSYGAHPIAEHTFGLILALTHNIAKLDRLGEQNQFNYQNSIGTNLAGKTIGIVGINGAIGQKVAKLADAFEMQIIANDTHVDSDLQQRYNIAYTSLNQLLKDSDIITLHCPLNEQTKYLLNKKNLTNIGKNKVFINTARGGLISNQDLLWALESQVFKQAGLDTLENENNIFAEHHIITPTVQKIIDNPNVILTPHSAYYTRESIEVIISQTIKNIQDFIKNYV